MSDTSAQLPGKAVPAKEKKPEKEIPAVRLASVILFAAAFSENTQQEALLKGKTARWILICRISDM